MIHYLHDFLTENVGGHGLADFPVGNRQCVLPGGGATPQRNRTVCS